MASPKNWKRNKNWENNYKEMIFVWEHSNNEKIPRVKVIEVNNQYVTGKYKIEGISSLDRLYDNKQKARKDAVTWMKNHPMGVKRTSKGMSKFERSRANRGR